MTPTDTIGDDVRLYRGDAMGVLPALADESFDAVITDPPYGMSFQSAWRTEKTERFDVIANDDAPFVWWLRDAARVIKPGGCLVCFCRWDSAEAFRLAIGWAGLKVGAQLVWDRVVHGMGDPSSRPSPRHDTIWFAVKGRYKLPAARPSSVYAFQRLGGEELDHPNQKPVALMTQLARDYVPAGGRVLDPFMGSGSTGVGVMRMGGGFEGIEVDKAHYETARKRLVAATGGGPNQLFAG